MTKSGALHPSWLEVIGTQFQQPHMLQLKAFLQQQKKGKTIYPPGEQIFNAFNYTPFAQVRAVIIGQDPYHGPGQAHGLSFSVPAELRPLPPSLKNIDKELQNDLGLTPATHGDLTAWARQGVLLLNATLTVEARRAGSHQQCGWETFTDAAIAALNQQRDGLIFVLWGSYAQKKGAMIDSNRHRVLKSPHPSPLSAHRGFFGSKPFSAVNDYLQQQVQAPIDWRR